MIWIEVVGFAAAALAILALVTRSRVRLRVLWLAASALFGAYGVLTGSWPVVAASVAVAVAGVLQLRRELTARDRLAATPIEPQAPFLRDFLGAHAIEIQNSQPDYHPDAHDTFVRLLIRDGFPAGVIVGEPAGKELLVKLDYVTPAFRDSQLASWVFGPGRATFTDQGFTRLVAAAHTSVHRNYLEMVGFRAEGNAYVLDLT